jgi:Phosphotransferase enzyme family
MFGSILSRYGFDESEYSVKAFGNGLINHTWKIIYAGKEFLLQRINQQVFTRPMDIMDNCSLLAGYFKNNHPGYLFVSPILALNHMNFVIDDENNYYRLFPFVQNSYTCDTVTRPSLAYEAARQFGRFTRLLSPFDPTQLHITLPDFHNLSLRHQQFVQALENGSPQRLSKSAESIHFLQLQQEIVNVFEKAKSQPSFTQRVIHHDAKINNVLFDIGTDLGLCVIDLDTVMTGYYISDVGDMLRTYLSPVSEEESDLHLVQVREEYFSEIVKGYLGEMQPVLSEEEKSYFVYSGKFAIYLQAIRFLTDYLNNDRYYLTKYPDQNLVRAKNQVTLLKRFIEKEELLEKILNNYLKEVTT